MNASNSGVDDLGLPPAYESHDFNVEVKNGSKTVDSAPQMATKSNSTMSERQRKKKMKKSIFISYSPDAGFTERKFILETVKQIKENNLADDIWFDKDEQNTDSPSWFSLRLEAVERCRAAILFLSESFFSCPVSIYESKTLLERQKVDPGSVRVYIVLYSMPQNNEIPKIFQQLLTAGSVDLVRTENAHKLSMAEKTSMVVGAFMEDLEKLATIHAPPALANPPDTEFTGEYKKKKICQWTPADLQEWLYKLGIKEFYRQSLAENMVDGFLLMSMTDADMIAHLGIDSRVVRKKIMQQILATLDKEHKLMDSWHLRARTQRARSNCLYMVYDPTDVRLAQSLKQDLIKKNIQVINHQKLGQSKEEFLQLNGALMATASHLLVVLTDNATSSPFVYHEVLFGDWLGKKIITAMFKDCWSSLRPSLKAVIGDCPAIDFASQMYAESLDVLDHHIKPLRAVPGVVLEQSYLNKMADGVKPLAMLTNNNVSDPTGDETPSAVFISYQWDMHSRVEELDVILQYHGFSTWADISPTMGAATVVTTAAPPSALQRGSSGRSMGAQVDGETLQSQIQRNMKACCVVLCCITPKYLQSDNCVKDLTLAETFHKPIIPVMLRFCPWPPEAAPSHVRRILAKHTPVDLSNDKLFKQNVSTLLDKIRKVFSQGK